MKRTRRTQAERSSETRERILGAAAEVMISRGYAGFRVNEVADVAGVSRGAQLHHFGTKHVLIAEALKRVFVLSHEINDRRVDQIRRTGGISSEQLVNEIIAGAKDFYFNRNFLFILDMALSAGKDGDISEVARDIIQTEGRKNEVAWLELLDDLGLDPMLAQDVLWMLWSAVRGVLMRRLSSEPERAQRIENHVLGMLAGMTVKLIGDVIFELRPSDTHS